MKKKRIRKEVEEMRQNAESLGAINRAHTRNMRGIIDVVMSEARAESHEYWAERLRALEKKLR